MADVKYLLGWDGVGEKKFEAGVDRGVLYKTTTGGAYGKGVAWSGLTAVNESPSGAEENKHYADNIKYASILSAEDFGFTIEAFQSPAEFDECDGTAEIAPGVTISQQSRKAFGFSWRSLIGNDVADVGDLGYIIHLAYGCKAQPSEKSRGTINESPEPTTFSWTVATTPVNVTGKKPTAHLQINSLNVDADKLKAFEAIIYGTPAVEADLTNNVEASPAVDARLPLPDEVATFFASQG